MKVRIVGASSPFPPERLQAGVAVLRKSGFDVDDEDALVGRHAYLNGSDDERVAALDDALAGDADVVWLARGGYGLTRIASRLQVPARIPVVVGFSDATALFARLHNEGLAHRCVHGPLATSIAHEPTETVAHVVDVVGGGAGRPLPALRAAGAVRRAHVEAPLFSANLCVLAALCGTPLQPDLRGHVVVLEEVGERPYRLDRMLTQCLAAGVLRDLKGVVVGHLTQCEEPAPSSSAASSSSSSASAASSSASSASSSTRDPAPRAVDVFVERLAPLGVPLALGLPVGHEAPNYALPLGGAVAFDVDGDVATLGLSRR